MRSIGAIGDRSFVLDPEGTASSGSPQREDDWSILRAASADQALLAWEQFPIGGGTPLTAGGVVVMPGTSPSSAMFYCASDAAPTSGAADAPVAVLSQLSVLGQCPGTPVSGNVVVCTAKGPAADGGAACLAFGATGAVDGTDIGLGTQGGSTVRPGNTDSVFDVVASGTNQGAIVVTSAAGGSVTGWLRLPNGTDPNAGMIYCLDNGQLANRAAGVYSVTFQSISRLGQCPGTTPIAGQINLCD